MIEKQRKLVARIAAYDGLDEDIIDTSGLARDNRVTDWAATLRDYARLPGSTGSFSYTKRGDLREIPSASESNSSSYTRISDSSIISSNPSPIICPPTLGDIIKDGDKDP